MSIPQHTRLDRHLALAAFLVAFVVVVLGAYVRLSDAGLGCPDWPGCYGRMVLPADGGERAAAAAAYPERPLEAGKAWKEMIHRYAAGGLGLLILGLAVRAWLRPGLRAGLPTALLGLVIFQALLGMWTVTLLLKPLVVVAHLAGGFSVLALLWWYWLRLGGGEALRGGSAPGWAMPAAGAGLALLVLQILLGGWTSSNYAALACTGFPACVGQYWPDMDFARGFTLWHGLGIDYEGGVLDHPARVAIHMTHRMGAGVVALVVGGLGIGLLLAARGAPRVLGAALLAALSLQIGLGVANVLMYLPLPVAVAHNGAAALLLLTLLSVLYGLRRAAS